MVTGILEMNPMNDNADSVVVRPVPLFASSWVALFAVIRHSLADRTEGSQTSEAPPQR